MNDISEYFMKIFDGAHSSNVNNFFFSFDKMVVSGKKINSKNG